MGSVRDRQRARHQHALFAELMERKNVGSNAIYWIYWISAADDEHGIHGFISPAGPVCKAFAEGPCDSNSSVA